MVILLKKKYWLIITLLALVFLTSNYWLTAYGQFLVVNERTRRCDAIVVLSGETVPRVAKAVELYKQGYAGLIIMSGGGRLTSKLTDADLMMIEAVDLGVSSSVLLKEDKSESTYENAVNVKKIIVEHHIKSFLLITSNYHTRRSKYVFEHALKGTGVEFVTVSAPDNKFSPNTWWKNHEGQQKALTELANMIIYWFKY